MCKHKTITLVQIACQPALANNFAMMRCRRTARYRFAVDPLPADRDYPVRLVWTERDRVMPFEHYGPAMLERYPGRS